VALPHGARLIVDGHYAESVREHLATHGMTLLAAPAGDAGKAETYVEARKILHEGRLRLPNDPRLLMQLRQVTSKPMAGGRLSISSPRRPGGGHGDLGSALVLALWSAKRFGGSDVSSNVVGRREFAQADGGEHLDVDVRGNVRARRNLRQRGTGGF
jgi:hypothetical protein